MTMLPLVFGGGMLVLAADAAPDVPTSDNPVSLFSFVILVAGIALLVSPTLCKWDWKARYFGAGLASLSSNSLMTLGPFLCIVLYSKLPGIVRLALSAIYLTTHLLWGRRFVEFYRMIEHDPELLAMLYHEEDDAVYYIQKADRYLFEKKHKLEQFPPSWLFVACMLTGVAFTPFMSIITRVVGLPFTHIFLTVAAHPISLLGLGFLVRGWIIFFYFPTKFKRASGKET